MQQIFLTDYTQFDHAFELKPFLFFVQVPVFLAVLFLQLAQTLPKVLNVQPSYYNCYI